MLEQLVKFLEEQEGCVLTVYKDSVGIDTIGIGTLWKPNMPRKITKQEALDYCTKDCVERLKKIDKVVKVLINDNQRIAIASLVYNVGYSAFSRSTLLKLLNQGKMKEAALQFLKWDKERVNGVLQVSKGLHNRRVREMNKFNANTQGMLDSPSGV